MNVTDIFAQADITGGVNRKFSTLDIIKFQTPKANQGPSAYRRKFQEGLRKNSLGKPDGSNRHQDLENRIREDISPSRNSASKTDDHRLSRQEVEIRDRTDHSETARNEYAVDAKAKESRGSFEGQSAEASVSTLEKNTEIPADVSEEESQATVTQANVVGLNSEVIEPPASFVKALDAVFDVSGEPGLAQIDAEVDTQEIQPPASFLEAIETSVTQKKDEDVQVNSEYLLLQGVEQIVSAESVEVVSSQEDEVKNEEGVLLASLPSQELDTQATKQVEGSGEQKNPESEQIVSEGDAVTGVVADLNKNKQESKVESKSENGSQVESGQLEIRKDNKNEKAVKFEKASENITQKGLSNSASIDKELSPGLEIAADKNGAENTVGLVSAKIEAVTDKTVLTQNETNNAVASVDGSKTGLGKKVAVNKTSNAVQSNSSEFVDRVSTAVQRAAKTGNQMKIRLNPPELGVLLVEVSSKDGVLTARMEVQTQSAQQAIMENLSHLKESLVQNGNNIEAIEVHVNETSTEESQRGRGQEQKQEQGSSENFSDNPEKQKKESESEESIDDQSGQELQLDELDIQI